MICHANRIASKLIEFPFYIYHYLTGEDKMKVVTLIAVRKLSLIVVKTVAVFLATLALFSCASKVAVQSKKWTEESIRKYLDDNKDKLEPIEGIYSISSEKAYKLFGVTTPSKKNNDFARVAILKNQEDITPEFIEYWLEGLDYRKYSKTAEFTRIQKSSSYLCKKTLPGADPTSYAFAYDDDAGSMEGVQKANASSKLFYLKVYPAK